MFLNVTVYVYITKTKYCVEEHRIFRFYYRWYASLYAFYFLMFFVRLPFSYFHVNESICVVICITLTKKNCFYTWNILQSKTVIKKKKKIIL